MQIYGLEGPELKLVAEYERKAAIKCGTFGASGLMERQLATGNFEGRLQIWDMERPQNAVFDVQAHASIVNMVDGCGGQAKATAHRNLQLAGVMAVYAFGTFDRRALLLQPLSLQKPTKPGVLCIQFNGYVRLFTLESTCFYITVI